MPRSLLLLDVDSVLYRTRHRALDPRILGTDRMDVRALIVDEPPVGKIGVGGRPLDGRPRRHAGRIVTRNPPPAKWHLRHPQGLGSRYRFKFGRFGEVLVRAHTAVSVVNDASEG